MRPARRRTPALAGAIATALLGGLLFAPGASGDPVPPPVAPVTYLPQDDAVCPNLFGYTDDTLKRKTARAIMAGTVDLGDYGVMTIPLDPTGLTLQPSWRTQSSLDLAGNRYIDSLEWTVPLLRVGADLTAVRPDDPEGPAMTAQFVALLRSWVASQPKPAKRGVWVNHPQYGGFRLGVFVCAARELADPVDNAWAVEQARAELAVQLAGFSVAGANNTMLNAQLAAYAAAQQVGSPAQQAQARSNVMRLLTALVNADGSDKEGAPGYGRYLATIESRTATVLAQYGDADGAAAAQAAISRSADFLVAASRPDRRIETIGDTDYQRIPATLFAPDSPATWVATSGAEGSRPSERYTTWSGGYAFGHSRWVPGDDEESTFYSVRTGASTPNAAHRHSDTTAVTWYSQGVSWVADPGPYRYDTSTLRSYVRGRAAHSALVAPGSPRFVAPARWVRSKVGHGVERTCLRDPAYETTAAHVEAVRCVYYLRDLDALVVQDFVRPTERSRTVRQQFVLPPEVTTAKVAGTTVALRGETASGAARSAALRSTRTPVVRKATATRAVLGRKYGQREDGRVVKVAWKAPVGLTSVTTTVLTPGSQDASVTPTGAKTLRITVGARTVSVPAGFAHFPRPRADVKLHASKPKLKTGKRVVLSGKVRAAGRKLGGVTVRVERYRPAKHRWVLEQQVRTDAKGRYQLRTGPGAKGAHAFRASVVARSGASGWKPASSPTVTVTVVERKHH